LFTLVTRLSRVVFAGALVLLAADSAVAQITVNGSGGAVAINRGDTIAVNAGGGSAARDWVGLYAAGASNGNYLEWWYLNGTHGAPV
jgi:hypothetical protein